MTYDNWKDEYIGLELFGDEEETAHFYVEPRSRTYAVVDERDGRDVEHFPIGRDWRVALQLAETLRDELNGGGPL